MMEPLRRYDSLEQADHESASTTDVDQSSLMGDDKTRDWHPPSLRQRAIATFHAYRWILDTSLLVVILLLVMRDRQPPPSSPWEIGGDFTGVAPKCVFPPSSFPT